MARLARGEYLYGGCYVHVISRSIRQLEIFKDKEDFECFLRLLETAKKETSLKIYHYCLMHTHFHMVVKAPRVKKLSKAIQGVKSQYSYKFHTKYRLSGPIWRERYRSLLIEDENYLYACGAYVENNPVKAGLVRQAKDWAYSSSRYYQEGKKDELVDGYETMHLREVDVYMDEEDFFENGSVIGSASFLFQFKKARKGV